MTLCRVYGGDGEMMISPEGYYEIALRGKSQSLRRDQRITGRNQQAQTDTQAEQ